jgi:V/A-type H+/Na+-transporting ATPase subunit C
LFDNKYLYSVTRTRTLETKLLDSNKIERMVETKTAEDVIKILGETEYANLISEMKHSLDYETIISKEIENTYKYMREILPEPELVDIFLLKYDIHNLKVLLKSTLLGEDHDFLLRDLGITPVNKLKENLKEKDFRTFHPIIAAGLEEILISFEDSPDPQMIDIILDRCQYNAMHQLAQKSKNKFLQDFIKSQIDMINIKSFLRIKGAGLGRDYLAKVLLQNGNLDYDYFAKYLDESLDSFRDSLWSSDFHSVLVEGLESYERNKTLTKLEKLADDYIFDIAKQGKYVAFGIEPLVGYLMAKENEAKIIRMIMVGKMNNISNEIIRERLRDVYV